MSTLWQLRTAGAEKSFPSSKLHLLNMQQCFSLCRVRLFSSWSITHIYTYIHTHAKIREVAPHEFPAICVRFSARGASSIYSISGSLSLSFFPDRNQDKWNLINVSSRDASIYRASESGLEKSIPISHCFFFYSALLRMKRSGFSGNLLQRVFQLFRLSLSGLAYACRFFGWQH